MSLNAFSSRNGTESLKVEDGVDHPGGEEPNQNGGPGCSAGGPLECTAMTDNFDAATRNATEESVTCDSGETDVVTSPSTGGNFHKENVVDS